MFGQEGRNYLAESLWFLDMRHVAGLFEQHPLRAGNLFLDRADDQRRSLVVLARHQQSWCDDLVELIGDVPVLQRADAVEL